MGKSGKSDFSIKINPKSTDTHTEKGYGSGTGSGVGSGAGTVEGKKYAESGQNTDRTEKTEIVNLPPPGMSSRPVGATFFANFKARKEHDTKKMNERADNSHLDMNDEDEKERQKLELREEAIHENKLAHKRIEGFIELMEVKGRFDLEREQVQRAEVKRFLCNVFLDMEVVSEEKKTEEGAMAYVSDFFGNLIPDFSYLIGGIQKIQDPVLKIQCGNRTGSDCGGGSDSGDGKGNGNGYCGSDGSDSGGISNKKEIIVKKDESAQCTIF